MTTTTTRPPVHVLVDPNIPSEAPITRGTIDRLRSWGYEITTGTHEKIPRDCHLAIAPAYQRIIPDPYLEQPRLGVLIFHPSLLPRRRGPDAVRWSFFCNDRVVGTTWFWADGGLDAGDICEQEMVSAHCGGLPPESPKDLYLERIVPAGLRCLDRILEQLAAGYVRRVPQEESASSYQGWYHVR